MTLIIHLGAPKTATSTLQNAFFPRHPGLLFLGKEVDRQRGWEGWRSAEIEALMTAVVKTSLDYKLDRATAARAVEKIAADAGGRPVVISNEDYCSFSGADSFSKIERMRELFGAFGPTKLILAVRDQVALLKSVYVIEHRGEMLRMPGTKQTWYPSFDQYLDIHFRYVCGAVLETYRFAAMIEKYESLVGPENVFVYAFDAFRRDAVGTLGALCRFMGVDDRDPCLAQTAGTRENERSSSRSYAAVRVRRFLTGGRSISGFLPKPVIRWYRGWLGQGAPYEIAPSADAVRRITEYYRADNEALFGRRGIRL